MNLPEEYRKGKFVILPIEYEGKVSYGKGAMDGSKEIIAASLQLEYYDCEFDCEPFEKGIELLNAVTDLSEIANLVNEKFTVFLGGDHAITISTVKALEKVHDEFSVIIFDAHPDMFHSWNGSENNHRCVSARVSNNHELALLGVRSMDRDEKNIIDNHENVHLVKADELSLDKIKEILPKLKQKVYLSIDVDVFDPSFIRNTGTPEPGGMQWQELINSLKLIFSEKEVIAADIVEFSPLENYRAEAYSLAKLVYKILALQDNNPFKETKL